MLIINSLYTGQIKLMEHHEFKELVDPRKLINDMVICFQISYCRSFANQLFVGHFCEWICLNAIYDKI